MKKFVLLVAILTMSVSSFAASRSLKIFGEDVKGLLLNDLAPHLLLEDYEDPSTGTQLKAIKFLSTDCAKKIVDLSVASKGYVEIIIDELTEVEIVNGNMILMGVTINRGVSCKSELINR